MDRHKKLTRFDKRFADFESFSGSIRNWDVDFCQLDRGDFQAEMTQLETPEVLITHAFFNRKLEQKGKAPPGAWTFAFLQPSSPEIIWRGQKVSCQNMMLYPPGSEIDALSPPGFHVLTLSVPLKVFEGWDALNRLDGGRKTLPLCAVTEVNPLILTAIRSTAQHATSINDLGCPVFQNLIKDLQDLIVTALGSAHTVRPKPSIEKRTHIIKILTVYIDEHLENPISLAELSIVAGASLRTVQYAFMDRLGVTPKKYIKIRRLNRVHRELLKRDNRTKVISDVANDWGFWHMGQFASDYRRLFGELPSETLIK